MAESHIELKKITPLPKHVAIIMDGNGRWAKERNFPRWYGHRAGSESVKKVIDASIKYNIDVLTLFAFSSENWNRPKEEVDYLMKTFVKGLRKEVPKMHKRNIQFKVIGNRSRFHHKVLPDIEYAELMTCKNTGLKLNIAIDYGGRWDIVNACRAISERVLDGTIVPDEINEELFSEYLVLKGLPDVDLFIRTSGEQRISNFLLWQLSYSELYFPLEYWPDFNEESFYKALEFYSSRNRRFGRVC